MSAAPSKGNEALLAELASLPEGQTGEVIGGALHVMGRPGAAHQEAQAEIAGTLRFRGPGGKGGAWIILNEVSVRFQTSEEVVPDIAGWHRARFGERFEENPIQLRPDWVCEILSDSTRRKDLGLKRQLYAAQEVTHLWLVDPKARELEAFALRDGAWTLLGSWADADTVRGLAPFPEVTLELERWWCLEIRTDRVVRFEDGPGAGFGADHEQALRHE